jgi:hypothetical protein
MAARPLAARYARARQCPEVPTLVALFRWRAAHQRGAPTPGAGVLLFGVPERSASAPLPLLRVALTCEDSLLVAKRDRALRTLADTKQFV